MEDIRERLFDIMESDISQEGLSAEMILSSVDSTANDYSDILKFHRVGSTMSAKLAESKSTEVNASASNIRLIDIQEFFNLIYDPKSIANMLVYINSTTKNSITHIFADRFVEASYWSTVEAPAILNMIRMIKGTVVYHFSYTIGFFDLFLAMVCNTVCIGPLSSMIVVENVMNGMCGELRDVHNYNVRYVYDYWVDAGLLTADELLGLFVDESAFSVSLQHDEVLERLVSRGKVGIYEA